MAPSHGFGAQHRLRQRKDFETLLRQGTRKSLAGYVFYLRRRESGPPRLGVLVSRRHAALATARNVLKRRIREAFRLEKDAIGAIDVLVRPPYVATGSVATVAELRTLFVRLGK